MEAARLHVPHGLSPRTPQLTAPPRHLLRCRSWSLRGIRRRDAARPRETLTRHWKLGVALGVVFGIAPVRNVLCEEVTPRPGGAYYVFELIWRGGIHGALDALLLTVLPCLVVYRALGGQLAGWPRRLTYLAMSLALVMAITAVYHLGFEQHREDGVGAPETGNAIISLPMPLSANPIGSITDHAAMHISAVAHSYETEVRLPPPAKAR